MKTKKHEHKQIKTQNVGLTEALLKYKGFTITIIAVIIFLLVLAFVKYDPAVNAEKLSYAQQFHTNAQSDLNTYLQGINEEIATPQQTTLDATYLSSTRDDMLWLSAKENTIYFSRPSIDLYPKEAAFYLFMQEIIQVNQDYSFDLTNPNYDAQINKLSTLELKQKQLLTEQELLEAFTTQNEIQIYEQTLNKLYNDYFNSKKQFINTITSKERQFVEAKKLDVLVMDANN